MCKCRATTAAARALSDSLPAPTPSAPPMRTIVTTPAPRLATRTVIATPVPSAVASTDGRKRVLLGPFGKPLTNNGVPRTPAVQTATAQESKFVQVSINPFAKFARLVGVKN